MVDAWSSRLVVVFANDDRHVRSGRKIGCDCEHGVLHWWRGGLVVCSVLHQFAFA